MVRDPLHRGAMQHRRRADYHGEQLWLAPPEYVLLRKLEVFRKGRQDKHLNDLRFMLAVTELDRRFIETNVERLGLRAEWDELQEAYRAAGGDALD